MLHDFTPYSGLPAVDTTYVWLQVHKNGLMMVAQIVALKAPDEREAFIVEYTYDMGRYTMMVTCADIGCVHGGRLMAENYNRIFAVDHCLFDTLTELVCKQDLVSWLEYLGVPDAAATARVVAPAQVLSVPDNPMLPPWHRIVMVGGEVNGEVLKAPQTSSVTYFDAISESHLVKTA